MKKIYKQVNIKFFLIVTLLIISSCESLIETESPNNQIGTNEVFEDTTMVQSALASIYTAVRNTSMFSGSTDGLGIGLSLYTDELDCYYPLGHSSGLYDIAQNNVLSTNVYVGKIWNNAYTLLYAINNFIIQLEKTKSIEELDKHIYLGEAYFLRGIIYFNLTQLFGDIPYTTETNYQLNSVLKKTNKKEVLELIESDFVQAMLFLSDNYRSNLRIYPNKTTAKLLLSKLYLETNQFQKAEEYSKEIVNNPLYQLEKDVNKVFTNTSKGVMWQIKPNANNNATLEAINFYFEQGPPQSFALNNKWIEQMDEQDLRKKEWIKTINNNGKKWYRPIKYKKLNGQNTDEFSIVFRIEEAYFVYIESLVYQNKVDEATNILNSIKTRAGLAKLSNINKDDLIKEMLNEMQYEFFTEQGHRFFDLKRNKQLERITTIKPNWKEYHLLLPYPEKEILLNGNLKPQNNGY